ncbi:MAG: hypothetical protein WDO69_35600 [Pseudomonadota bacterium]
MTMKPMFVSIGLSLAMCVACGGSSDGGNGAPANSSGNYSSGVSGDKQLGALTDQEFQGVCKNLSDYFSSGAVGKGFEEFTCRFEGLLAGVAAQTDAELQAACKATYDQCVAAPTTTTETCTKPDASCTATVAEYDACVNDSAKALTTLANSIPSCDKLTMASLGMIAVDDSTATPASCTTLQTKCPSAPKPPGM